jgi:hypothetical protein
MAKRNYTSGNWALAPPVVFYKCFPAENSHQIWLICSFLKMRFSLLPVWVVTIVKAAILHFLKGAETRRVGTRLAMT